MFAKFEALFFTMDLLQTLILQLYSGTAQLLVKNTFSLVVQVWFLYIKKRKKLADDRNKKIPPGI